MSSLDFSIMTWLKIFSGGFNVSQPHLIPDFARTYKICTKSCVQNTGIILNRPVENGPGSALRADFALQNPG